MITIHDLQHIIVCIVIIVTVPIFVNVHLRKRKKEKFEHELNLPRINAEKLFRSTIEPILQLTDSNKVEVVVTYRGYVVGISILKKEAAGHFVSNVNFIMDDENTIRSRGDEVYTLEEFKNRLKQLFQIDEPRQ